MTARRVAIGLSAVIVFYFIVIGRIGVALVQAGGVVGVGLGIGVLLLPVVGAVLVAGELRFGLAGERLARELEAAGQLPAAAPDGVAAADLAFERVRSLVEQRPDDWAAWYLLALAYDDARDRSRGRRAMRRAIALHRRSA